MLCIHQKMYKFIITSSLFIFVLLIYFILGLGASCNKSFNLLAIITEFTFHSSICSQLVECYF